MVFGDNEYFQTDPYWRDLVPFYEYFHGDTGRGLGASHQTVWASANAPAASGAAGEAAVLAASVACAKE